MESSAVNETDRPDVVSPKMKFTGKVVKISLAGAVIDIGREHPAVIHISQLLPNSETEQIKRVEDVLEVGQEIEVWVRKSKDDRVELTMVKPLDLEWREIKKGMTVKGTVVRLEKFGAFVEIGAERPGLIHISEMAHGYVRTPGDVVKEGDEVEAEVLEVNRRKKQIKLSMKALQPEPEPVVVEEPQQRTTVFDRVQPAKDKPVRRKKAPRKQRQDSEGSADFDFELGQTKEAEAEPTAMEIAIREAMEKAKTRKKMQEDKKKSRSVSQEQEEILSRTLGQKSPAQ